MPKLPQGPWSHGMCGADAEVASRPDRIHWSPKELHHLTSPQNICLFNYNITNGFFYFGGDPRGHMLQLLPQSRINFKPQPGCLTAQLHFEHLQEQKFQKLAGFSCSRICLISLLRYFSTCQISLVASCIHFTTHHWKESGSMFSIFSH